MVNKKGVPWRHLCGFNQLDSDRGYYTWAWERKKNLWAIMWKDRSVVPLISNRYGVQPETIERGGGGKYKTAKLKPTNVPYGRYTFATGKMVRPSNRYMGGRTCGTSFGWLCFTASRQCPTVTNGGRNAFGG